MSETIQDLENLLSPLAQKTSLKKKSFSSATTNIQDADEEDVVFYFLTEKNDAIERFNKRWTSEIGCLITNRLPPKYHGSYVLVDEEDFLKSQSLVADTLYPRGKRTDNIVGVTGTNGKTTTVDFIRQLGAFYNKTVVSIGTLGLYVGTRRVEHTLNITTPSYLELRKILATYDDSADLFAVEVSSHSLAQNRFYDLTFSDCGWTSFSQDHLDYHENFEAYFKAKMQIVSHLSPKGKVYVSERDKDLIDKIASTEKRDCFKVVKKLNDDLYISNPLFEADYNRVNLELAWEISRGRLFNSKASLTTEMVRSLNPAPGRFETAQIGDRTFIVDFAHTPEALENICQAVATKKKEGEKLLTVFGCGGDRDKTKRPQMGAIACKYSEQVIITSDNPRSEDPETIIREILEGCGHNATAIPDRKQAINESIGREEFKFVIIAGKGHETFQEIKGKKYPFDDMGILKNLIQQQKSGA